MNKTRFRKGFSLIELLVVIAIMTILISLSAFGLQQARESARDGQRRADLETIRTGLSMYKSDCNAYPINSGGNFASIYSTGFSSVAASCNGLSNTYIQKVPSDPIPGNYYYYVSNGITYKICAVLETETTADTNCTGIACSSGSATCTYSVINP